MDMPVELRLAVESKAEGIQVRALSASAEQISGRYRGDRKSAPRMIRSAQEAIAYAAARMPATYGAAGTVLGQLADLLPEGEEIASVTDVGAGTGTASWAAAEFVHPARITCLEHDPFMRALGEELTRASDEPALNRSRWSAFDVTQDPMPGPSDLVIASYVLNEVSDAQRIPAVMKLWQAADKYLVLIEPGTPEGYRQLMQERDALLARGAHLAGPCAHEGPCPLTGDDWCHFACRVSRSRLQKALKDGQAPYEDEKFAYMIFSHTPVALPARVLRHPQVEPGRITLTLCTEAGREIRDVRKKDADFKRARKAGWGEAWRDEKAEAAE